MTLTSSACKRIFCPCFGAPSILSLGTLFCLLAGHQQAQFPGIAALSCADLLWMRLSTCRYSASYSFNPGDLISTTCVYSTSGMEEVAGGLGSENEMCIHFFYAYPEEAINKNRCHDSMLLHEPWPVELSSVTQDQQALSQLLDFETKPDVPSAAKWWDSVDLTSVVSTCDLFGMFEICDLDMGTLQDIDFCSSDLLSEECLEALRECETMFEVIEGFCGSEDDGIAPAEPVTMVNTLSETPDTDDQVSTNEYIGWQRGISRCC